MATLSKEELSALKAKMPSGYVKKVIEKYRELNKSSISTSAIYCFFRGTQYSTELHESVLSVAKKQQDLMLATKELIS